MHRSPVYWAFSVILFCASDAGAQAPLISAHQSDGIPRSPFSVGIEGGWIRSSQSGSFLLNCQCVSKDGKGNSAFGDLLIEYADNGYFSFGLKAGVDSKLTVARSSNSELMTITFSTPTNPNDSVTTGTIPMVREAQVQATYFFLAPYFKLSPLGKGVFLEIAPELGILTSSNVRYSRKITSSSVTLTDGSVINDLRFDNGTHEEVLQDGPITDPKRMRIALLFSAGYDIPLSENFSVVPQATYNFPLSEISVASGAKNWRLSSYMLILGLQCRI